MRVLLTGATGFVGGHLLDALLARGDEVRCLVRATSSRANLEGREVEVAEGDLRDPASVARAAAGCAEVYHCAADYRLYARRPRDLYESNVEGTRNVLAAAAEHGAERVVYTSSVGALGLEPDGSPATEETPVSLDDMVGHYKRSKYLAEREAEAWAARGLPVVIVNPSTPVGERDLKPTPTGRIVLDFLEGRSPAYVDTGLNLIDVRDVAAGHLLAAERGRVGERYILGHRNLTLRQIFGILAELTGRRAPRLELPHWVPIAVGAVDTAAARLLGREPRVPLEAARLARHRMFFDAGKAVRELGLAQTPVEEALGRAVEWFRGPRAAAGG
ncbi:MAG: NAD-dependent epimerase/dehydratase family protein [Thermoanaerobaculia bacterium]|nr:NAD-dependent epimerase/dehydratase family protein [Thermoanaerobaculia bacterium]